MYATVSSCVKQQAGTISIIQMQPHIVWDAYIAHIGNVFTHFLFQDLYFYEHQTCDSTMVTSVLIFQC